VVGDIFDTSNSQSKFGAITSVCHASLQLLPNFEIKSFFVVSSQIYDHICIEHVIMKLVELVYVRRKKNWNSNKYH
jgi:hypothetical protein